MRLLLHTCVAIWIFEGSPRISPALRALLTDPDHGVWSSDFSVLEVVIKHRLGKLALKEAPSRRLPCLVRAHGRGSLPLSDRAIHRLETLPPLHADPFDRLLIGQALAHRLVLVTPDERIRQYEVPVRWESWPRRPLAMTADERGECSRGASQGRRPRLALDLLPPRALAVVAGEVLGEAAPQVSPSYEPGQDRGGAAEPLDQEEAASPPTGLTGGPQGDGSWGLGGEGPRQVIHCDLRGTKEIGSDYFAEE
jgi:PIN domain nuclease of toxin-antitoxin system